MSCSLSKKAYASQTLYSKDKYRENRLKNNPNKTNFSIDPFLYNWSDQAGKKNKNKQKTNYQNHSKIKKILELTT